MSDQIPSDETLNIAGMSTIARREIARVLSIDPDLPVAELVHAVRVVVVERREAREWCERHRPLLEQARAPSPTDPITVYTHVERTVHALLDAITAALPDAVSPTAEEGTVTPEGIKILAEAVQALSSWPQFNPMNAVDDYRKIAEYEVERAIKDRIPSGELEAFAKWFADQAGAR